MKLIILFIVKSLLVGYLTYILLERLYFYTQKKDTNGQLYYGWPVYIMTVACIALTAFMAYAYFVLDYEKNLISTRDKVAFFFCFFIFISCGIVFLLELKWTRGFYDNKGIGFQSIWRGRRYYEWKDLESIVYSEKMGSHVFSFNDGKKIYIHALLCGYDELMRDLFDNDAE